MKNPKKTDGQLVEAFLLVDIGAFEQLINRYRYAVFGLCAAYTRDFDAAEDAAQEAFITSFLRIQDLPRADRFGPWLRRIAINECKMWMRRQSRSAPLDEVREEMLVSSSSSPESEMDSRETRQQVLNAIAHLTGPQQQVVVLFYLKSMSLKQIASFLEISAQSVNQRLYRARTRLKEGMVKMVNGTLGDYKLPENFTEEVFKKTLDRGKLLLEEGKFPAAKNEFRKVVEADPGHAEAQRGLALALSSEVGELMRMDPEFGDRNLLKDTFGELERAYQLEGNDYRLVWTLDGLYARFGRFREAGELLEKAADGISDEEQSIAYLRRATDRYYRANDLEAVVRCHRRARTLLPQDLDPQEKLHLWCSVAITIAYPRIGSAEEALSQIEELGKAVGDNWSIYGRRLYHQVRSRIFLEMKQWEKAAREGCGFVEWLKAIPEEDPQLFDFGPFHKGLTGEKARWSNICDMLASVVARAEHEGGLDPSSTFDELDWALGKHQGHWQKLDRRTKENPDDQDLQREAKDERWHLTMSFAHAGEAAYRTGRYRKAVQYFESVIQYGQGDVLIDYVYFSAPLRNAASLFALDRVKEAKERLGSISGEFVTSGQCRAYFEDFKEFEGVKEDPDIVEIVEKWIKAEGIGRG